MIYKGLWRWRYGRVSRMKMGQHSYRLGRQWWWWREQKCSRVVHRHMGELWWVRNWGRMTLNISASLSGNYEY
jgi:hypothetical protein